MEIKKISKTLLCIALAMCAISFASCSSSNDDDDTPPPPPPVTSEKQLPRTITRTHTPDGGQNPTETETIQYSYDSQNRVTQISNSLNSSGSTGGISQYNRAISYTPEGRVEKVEWTSSTGYTEVVTHIYTYNGNEIEVKTSNDVLVEKIQIDNNGRVIRREQPADPGRSAYIVEPTSTIINYRYDSNGNITSEAYESSGYVASYTYDTSKKGIFAEVKSPQWLLVTLDTMITSFNNPATQKSEGETGGIITVAGDYVYTFNSDNYPTEETYTSQRASNKFKSVITVEYIAAN